MGKLRTVSTSQIMPSQDYLKQNTVEFILSCLAKNDFASLPPTPIVRKDPDSDLYIAIDGHNLIAVYDFKEGKVEVYVAESATDGLTPTTAAIILRNKDLAKKYEPSVQKTRGLQNQGLTSFKQLRNKYPEVADKQN